MKAIVMHEFGNPDVLKYEDFEKPEPQADEVVIKAFASGVNPVDTKIRAGKAQERFPVTLPVIIGWDVSGEIEEVGGNVMNFKKGDEVYSRPGVGRNGTYAEYVVVKASEVNKKPKSIDHDKAAGVPLAGLTAWQGLFDHGKLEEGQKVLIHAASGGVGSFAVQFAKWKGAYVIGTGSGDNRDFLKDLGVDEVIDYKNEKFEDKVHDVDLVFDLIGGDTQKRSISVVKNGGRIITTVQDEYVKEARAANIVLERFMAQSYAGNLEQIAQLIDAGKVMPVISEVMELKDAAKAHKLIEEGHVRGKIILEVA